MLRAASSRLPAACLAALLGLLFTERTIPLAAAASDLDTFMSQVLTRRDENWRKLQQYVLDEHERAEVLGPTRTRLFGTVRDYTWYIRDGIFVRSPVRADGLALSEGERRSYEDESLRRERDRAAHGKKADTAAETAHANPASPDSADLARIAREPRFVTSAYFLRFPFEPGHYAFAGREQFEGRPAYRVEYFPSRMFRDDERTSNGDEAVSPRERDETEERLNRQFNKVALITLWILPKTHQIVRYEFENIGNEFLPGRWLVRVDGLEASNADDRGVPGRLASARHRGQRVAVACHRHV